MPIVGALPNTIKNGDAEDATVVMNLFAYIQSQVNNNACPSTTGTSILKGNGSGGTQAAAAGTDFLAPAPGMVFDYAGNTVPSGYLLCDGSAVSRTTYSALFSAIGTTWGAGDGSTTFNVPDLRRRATIGAGGTSVSGPAATLGSVGGEEAHVLTTPELPAHNHTITITETPHSHANTLSDLGHSHAFGAASNIQNGGTSPSAFNAGTTGSTQSATTGITISNATATTGITANSANTGGGTAHNNMQPSAVVNKIIKV